MTVCELFESHQLVKTSNIRGTVHSSVPEQFALLDAVAARRTRSAQLRNVSPQQVTPEQPATRDRGVRFDGLAARSEIVAHARAWLADRETGDATNGPDLLSDSLLWGHSGLLRRLATCDGRNAPTFFISGLGALPGLPEWDFEEALANSRTGPPWLVRPSPPGGSRILLRRRTGCGGRRQRLGGEVIRLQSE